MKYLKLTEPKSKLLEIEVNQPEEDRLVYFNGYIWSHVQLMQQVLDLTIGFTNYIIAQS